MRKAATAVCALFLSLSVAGSGVVPARAEALKPRVIVFVHGIHGSREAWRASNGAYWPQLIQTDPHFQKSDVVVAEYPTPTIDGQLSTVQLSEILWQGLKRQKVWEHSEQLCLSPTAWVESSRRRCCSTTLTMPRASHSLFRTQHLMRDRLSPIWPKSTVPADPLLTDLRDGNDNNFLNWSLGNS